jgi:hypothetical protein
MWGSDTLTTLMSMTAINAPNITAIVISHLLTAGAAAAGAMGEAGPFIGYRIYSNIEKLVLWARSEICGCALGSMTLIKIQSAKSEIRNKFQ